MATSDSGRMRLASGSVSSEDRLVAVLYMLLRDHVRPSDLEAVVDGMGDNHTFSFSNGWIASYAQDLAARIRGEREPLPMEVEHRLDRPPIPDPKEFCAGAYAIVEADDFAFHELWASYALDSSSLRYKPGVKWEPCSIGYTYQIGVVDGLPHVVQLSRATVNDKRIIFWEVTSVAANWDLAKDWVRAQCPPGVISTNAMNFGHACR